ncbi:bifunctional 2-polyprenyl-6-hydroxyphenol methylase/3-demethylubiquinol 3-O-methyltransferase UbiG [Acetobacteraceae bacterium]|nr:bifunctional 2-polyprenyl-6-hydroxyphenol methylase/3-demethylubiquinol 3-O-methyltransferase UbiG [Acetobacteraceae bacterium]
MTNSSTLPNEISQFSALADKWWDPKGPMSPLHAMNPARIEWTQDQILTHFKCQKSEITLLDLGCGAGIATEALAKLGFSVTGADASPEVLKVANKRLEKNNALQKNISYVNANGEELIADHKQFDVVCAFEIIEHVRDPEDFLRILEQLTKPNGLIIVSTLNKTYASFLESKILAEYFLRLLPVGTHNWHKFLVPSELARLGRNVGLNPEGIAGLQFDYPYWKTKRSPGSNYILSFQKTTT